jgi:transglutaminase-like putative cysteine protease
VLNGFLRPGYPQAQLSKLQSILTKIFPGPVSDPYTAARMIYFWVLENTVYLQNLLPDTTIMDTRFGSCIQQTRLFINLCRLLRIPAREQSGMIFGRPCAVETGQKVQMANRGYTLLNHAWAEFYTPTRGWVPADMATSMGKRLLTAINVKDAAIRAEVIRDSQRYDDYYFGHTDPFRLYSSPEINKVITCPIVPNMEVEALKRLIFNTHHQFTCNFSFIENEVEDKE